MTKTDFIPNVLRILSRNGWLLFVTRLARLFAYGSLSATLVFYLLGLTEAQAGLVLYTDLEQGWRRTLTDPHASTIPQSDLIAVKLRWTFRLWT
jgi:hypothetical protein